MTDDIYQEVLRAARKEQGGGDKGIHKPVRPWPLVDNGNRYWSAGANTGL
jgi:hypothetical protein